LRFEYHTVTGKGCRAGRRGWPLSVVTDRAAGTTRAQLRGASLPRSSLPCPHQQSRTPAPPATCCAIAPVTRECNMQHCIARGA